MPSTPKILARIMLTFIMILLIYCTICWGWSPKNIKLKFVIRVFVNWTATTALKACKLLTTWIQVFLQWATRQAKKTEDPYFIESLDKNKHQRLPLLHPRVVVLELQSLVQELQEAFWMQLQISYLQKFHSLKPQASRMELYLIAK